MQCVVAAFRQYYASLPVVGAKTGPNGAPQSETPSSNCSLTDELGTPLPRVTPMSECMRPGRPWSPFRSTLVANHRVCPERSASPTLRSRSVADVQGRPCTRWASTACRKG